MVEDRDKVSWFDFKSVDMKRLNKCVQDVNATLDFVVSLNR